MRLHIIHLPTQQAHPPFPQITIHISSKTKTFTPTDKTTKENFTFVAKTEVMRTINPWINFNGNAEEAFTFYKSVLGGEFTKIVRFSDLASDDFPIPEHEANKIMTIALSIGKHQVLMANDVPEFMGRVNENENRSKILLSAESREEAERIFNGLSAGGEIEGPIGDSPWATYAAMFRDKYGIEWIIEFDPNYIG